MYDFLAGDRVIARGLVGNSIIANATGTVLSIIYDTPTQDDDFEYCELLIEFDVNIDGHNGEGLGRNGHCWYVIADNVRKLDSEIDSHVNPVIRKTKLLYTKFEQRKNKNASNLSVQNDKPISKKSLPFPKDKGSTTSPACPF